MIEEKSAKSNWLSLSVPLTATLIIQAISIAIPVTIMIKAQQDSLKQLENNNIVLTNKASNLETQIITLRDSLDQLRTEQTRLMVLLDERSRKGEIQKKGKD